MKLGPKYVMFAKPGCFPQIQVQGSVRFWVQYHSRELFRDIAWRIRDIVWHGLFGHIRHLRFQRVAMVMASRFMSWRFRDAPGVHRVRWESDEKGEKDA